MEINPYSYFIQFVLFFGYTIMVGYVGYVLGTWFVKDELNEGGKDEN